MRTMLLGLAAMGCGEPVVPDQQASPITMDLSGPSWLRPGQPATFAVTGADPGAEVFLVRGYDDGDDCVSDLGGACVDVFGAEVVGSGFANASGEVQLDHTPSAQLDAGKQLAYQAVALQPLLGSPVLELRTQPASASSPTTCVAEPVATALCGGGACQVLEHRVGPASNWAPPQVRQHGDTTWIGVSDNNWLLARRGPTGWSAEQAPAFGMTNTVIPIGQQARAFGTQSLDFDTTVWDLDASGSWDTAATLDLLYGCGWARTDPAGCSHLLCSEYDWFRSSSNYVVEGYEGLSRLRWDGAWTVETLDADAVFGDKDLVPMPSGAPHAVYWAWPNNQRKRLRWAAAPGRHEDIWVSAQNNVDAGVGGVSAVAVARAGAVDRFVFHGVDQPGEYRLMFHESMAGAPWSSLVMGRFDKDPRVCTRRPFAGYTCQETSVTARAIGVVADDTGEVALVWGRATREADMVAQCTGSNCQWVGAETRESELLVTRLGPGGPQHNVVLTGVNAYEGDVVAGPDGRLHVQIHDRSRRMHYVELGP